jgi:hypothetical protein
MHLSQKLAALAALAAVGCIANHAGAADDERLLFGMPVACELGKSCFVQNYVDVDPGPAARDFTCGGATYDGHKGIDIRLLSTQDTARSIAILAAAAGRIIGVRDGVPDSLLRDAGAAVSAQRECGNGVVIDHGLGWETQYCHLRSGSVTVKRGEPVVMGQPLGFVGFSGMADFAHVHFEIRRNSLTVDPFTGREPTGACSARAEKTSGLWAINADKLIAGLQGQIIETGFSGTIPALNRAEYGDATTPVTRGSVQIVFLARMINLRQGDVVRFILSGPANFNGISDGKPLERSKASFIAFSGRKLIRDEWPVGNYVGAVHIVREGRVVIERTSQLWLQ